MATSASCRLFFYHSSHHVWGARKNIWNKIMKTLVPEPGWYLKKTEFCMTQQEGKEEIWVEYSYESEVDHHCMET